MTDLDAGPSPIRDDSICESSLPPNKSSGDIVERTVFDPFLNKDVQVSDRLVDRLRGRYACGPTMPNGEPEFGWREFQTSPIQHEAAAEIERLRRELDAANSNHRSMAHQLAETGIRLEAIKRERDELYQANIEWARGNLVNAREKIAMECHALTAESAVAAAWEEAAKIAETFFFNDIGKLQVGPSIQDGIASAIRAAGETKTAESGHSPSTHNSESE
jgi:hypothetical protein